MDKIFAENILQGKVAFVTGGGTGITGGIARALCRSGRENRDYVRAKSKISNR